MLMLQLDLCSILVLGCDVTWTYRYIVNSLALSSCLILHVGLLWCRSMTQHTGGVTSLPVVPTILSQIHSTSTSNSLDHHHLHHQQHHLHQLPKQHTNHLLSTSSFSLANGPGSLASEHQHVNSIGKASYIRSLNSSTDVVPAMHRNFHRKELRTKSPGLNPPASTLSLPESTLLRVTRSNSGNSSSEDDGGMHRHSGSAAGVLLTSRDNGTQGGGGLNGKATLNGSVRKKESLTDSHVSLRPSAGMNCKRGDPDESIHRMGSPVGSGLNEDSSHILRNRTATSLRLRPYNISQRGSGSSNKSLWCSWCR